jgi:hypothetical protein
MVFGLRVLSLSAFLTCLVSGGTQAAGPAKACLLTSAEFAKFSGGNPHSDPQAFSEGTICTYDGAMIYFYAGKNSRAQWEATMKASGMGTVKQEPVTGVGDSAYAFFVSPQSAGQVGVAFVVFGHGEDTVAVSINPPKGKSAESVREQVIAAAKLAAAKLK